MIIAEGLRLRVPAVALGLAAATVGAGRRRSRRTMVSTEFKTPPPAPRSTVPGPDTKGKKTVRLDEIDAPPRQFDADSCESHRPHIPTGQRTRSSPATTG